MGDWSEIDALRDRVVRGVLVEVVPGPFSSLREAREALGGTDRAPDRLIIGGWEIFLSRRRQGSGVCWHLSARVHPYGRSVLKGDWEVVGRIAARVGAPPDPALVPRDPRAAVHWSWREQG